MYQRILFPTDFSANAQRLLPIVTRVARALEAEVLLMHVDEEERLLGPRTSDELVRFFRDIQVRRDEWMERLTAEVRAGDVPCRQVRTTGLASDEILKAAEQHGADLIAMPLIGAEGAKRILIGSTSKKVMRHAQCDMLTVGAAYVGPGTGTAGKILYPFDFSETAEKHLPTALRVAQKMDAETVLLKVLKVPSFIPSLPGEPPIVLPRASLDSLVTMRLAELEEIAAKHPEQRLRPTVTIGSDEAEAIVTHAAGERFDLLVIPRAGEGAFSRFFFGRVSHAVAKLSPVPVLTLANSR